MKKNKTISALWVVLLICCSATATDTAIAALTRTAPPEVTDTTGQRGGLIDPEAPEFPNWPYFGAKSPAEIPAYLDWRDNGGNWVSGVRDQGTCGSCWDFATIGMLESAAMIYRQQPDSDFDFSEQYVLSCIDGANSCNGGYANQACDFLVETGTPWDECLDYHASDAVPCDDACPDVQDQLHRLFQWWWVTTNVYDVEPIKEALQYGPVLTWMRVHDDFHEIRHDEIYTGYGSAYTDENHFVLIVGYDDANECWLVKNSYGPGWSGDGYFRIAYDNGCWFGLYTIAGFYDPPVSDIQAEVTLEYMASTYSDYDVEVRIFDDGGDIVTDVPFTVDTTLGQVVETDGNTGGYGIGHALIRTYESGPAVITVHALTQEAVKRTLFRVGPPPLLDTIVSIPGYSDWETFAVAWSPDGSSLAMVSADGSDGVIRFFDSTTWELVHTLTYESPVYGLAYNPAGTRMVIAFNSNLSILDLATYQIIAVTENADGNQGDSRSTLWPLNDRIISPDITSSDDYAKVLNESLNVLRTFTVPSFQTAGYNAASDIIFICSGADLVDCYDMSSGAFLHRFNIADPFSAAINTAGTLMAVSNDNDDIGLYSTSNWQQRSTITGTFTDEMAHMDWSSDGVTLAGIDEDAYFWAFDINVNDGIGYAIGKVQVGINGTDGMVKWHPEGKAIACATPSYGVQIFAPRDLIPPTLSVAQPLNGASTCDPNIQVSGTATDSGGMKAVIVSCGSWRETDFDLGDGFSVTVPMGLGTNQIVVRAVDQAFRFTEVVVEVQGVDCTTSAPVPDSRHFQAYPCYPNPANPSTSVAFNLPETQRVDVSIYDASGHVVRHVARDAVFPSGHNAVSWNGRDDRGHMVASGVYFCQIRAGEDRAVKRVLMLK